MTAARMKFAVFVLAVLGLPGSLMALGGEMVDLGKLALILSPGLAGLALNRGLGDRGVTPRWGRVALAAVVTLVVALVALAAAWISGVAAMRQPPAALQDLAAAIGGSALTSVLEELGWAGGGLALAVAAFGRRAGVAVLGLVWAWWHLIPALLKVGLFPYLEDAPAAMLVVFMAGCVAYRELLTQLRERASTWWAAAAGHAAPNILLAGAVAGGLGAFEISAGWWWFPGPGGIVFLLAALAAVIVIRQLKR